MKNCPKCNASISDTAKFCVKCGFNIKKYEEESSKEYFCAECGTKFSGGTFCPECGYNVAGDLGNEEQLPADSGLNIDISEISQLAEKQLFEKEGFTVDNGVLMKYSGNKRSIVIHDVEEIYDEAFKNNQIVTFVEINEGVKIIGKKAFANCKSLVKINIPKSCEKVYEDTFEGTNIEALILPEFNKELVKGALSVTAQKYFDFSNIDKYVYEKDGKSIVNLKKVENTALENKNAEEARIAEEKLKAEEEKRKAEEAEKQRKAEELKIKKQKESFEILDGVLIKYKGNDEEVTIPDGVTVIGRESFANANKTKTVIMPDSVVKIEESAFYVDPVHKHSNLVKIVLSKNLTYIGYRAFCACRELRIIDLPQGLEYIGEQAFNGCAALDNVTVPDSVTNVGTYAFCLCKSLLNVTIPGSIKTLPRSMFYDCTGLINLKISEGVKEIEAFAFDSCTALKSVTIPQSVDIIDENAFNRCDNITVRIASGKKYVRLKYAKVIFY